MRPEIRSEPGEPTRPVTTSGTRSASSFRLTVLSALLAASAIGLVAGRPYLGKLRTYAGSRAAGSQSIADDSLLSRGIATAEQGRWLEAVEMLDAAARAGEGGARLHHVRGRCLGELGWVEDAIGEYEQAVKTEPALFNAYINLATAYRSVGRRSDALGTLKKAEAVLRDPKLMETPQRYARPAAALLEDLAEAYGRLGDFPSSVRWAHKAQTADPTRTRGYLLAAKSLYVLKQTDRAIPLLQRAVTVAPQDPDCRYTLALALRARPTAPHTASARKHLIAAIEIEQNHAPALYQLGLICMERKEWDNALTAFRRAYDLRYEPGTLLWKAAEASRNKEDSVQEAFFLGQYYEYVGELDRALTYFRSLAAAPQFKRIGLVFIARTEAKMGRYEGAIKTLERAISLDPSSAELRRQLAAIYDKLHVVSKQTAALEEAARIDNNGAHRDFYQLGKIALAVGDYDRAEQWLERAISRSPEVGQYHYSLGQTLLLRSELQDRLARAIRHLEEAQRLTPDSANTHDFLSSAYMKAQRWQEAAVSLHRSANIAAQNEVLYFRLNQVYRRLGSQLEAQRAQKYYTRLRTLKVERDLLTRRLAAKGRDPSTLFAMGDHFVRVRDYAGAKRQFEKLVDLDPQNPAVHERLVTVYGELAQPEGQLRHLRLFERLSKRGPRLAKTL